MTESDDLLNIRPLRRRLKEGKEALGMWLGITDPLAVEAIAADCDLDWVLLDMEHGGAGWDDLKMVMLGCRTCRCSSVLRRTTRSSSWRRSTLG